MLENNSTENVFRFVQMRPPLPTDARLTVTLPADTPLAVALAPRTNAERRRMADEHLRTHAGFAEATLASVEGQRVGTALGQALAMQGTLADFRNAFGPLGDMADALDKRAGQLADFLITAKFAGESVPRETGTLARLYRGIVALRARDDLFAPDTRLYDFLRRPIALPAAFSPPTAPDRSEGFRRAAHTAPPPPAPSRHAQEARRLAAALDELSAVVRPDLLHLPADDGTDATPAHDGAAGTPVPLALAASTAARLTPQTRGVLEALQMDPARQPAATLVTALESRLSAIARSAVRDRLAGTGNAGGGEAAGPSSSSSSGGPMHAAPPLLNIPRPYLKTVGCADLLIVKQHLLRYERADIAHVENVMAGETKSRTHRALERIEDTTLSEQETIREKQTELQTDERFELQHETSETAKEDQRFGFQLSLSGKYGPAVEFSSNAELDRTTSTEETTRTSTTYAKDILTRSLDKVTERMRTQHQRTVLRETEETNFHELKNQDGTHVTGTYQYLEKVYQSQVFNYGVREMFDFMVPEPASFLWYLQNTPATELNLPEMPQKLESLAPNARFITPDKYLELAAQFGAEGVTGPPLGFVVVGVSIKSGEGGDEEGQPRSIVDKDVPVPPGYKPFSATVRPLALTDNVLTLAINVGSGQRIWKPRNAPQLTDVGSGFHVGAAALYLPLATEALPREQPGVVSIQALAYETNTFGLSVELVFQRTDEAYEAWQVKTYDQIAAAYRASVQKYEQDVAERKAQAQAEAARARKVSPYGTAPSANLKMILQELKKHCLMIITRQRHESFSATTDDTPPVFDFDTADEEGAYIRFFEQAFEWEQMQYVFYPYFWARQSTWADRFRREEVDPVMQDFLRAGSARVVVPSRPGFEVAIAHYLETGKIWKGLGNPPPIHSPLYVPVVTEIAERTGAGQGEVAVGEPWLTHVPTPLVILRHPDTLPAWQRQDPDRWEWQEIP